MKQYIEKIKEKQNLTFEESKTAFEVLMEGKANDQEIFDFLSFLSIHLYLHTKIYSIFM